MKRQATPTAFLRRSLHSSDILVAWNYKHYQKIIVTLNETTRLMREKNALASK